MITLLGMILSSLLAPAAFATWECEGRTCSTSLWGCCCDSSAGARDSKCGISSRPAPARGVCAAGCSCLLKIQAVPLPHHSFVPSVPVPVFYPVILPAAPAITVVVPTEAMARAIETRGPPVLSRPFALPSLRAPPVA